MVSRSLLLGSLLAVLARAQSLSTTSLATSRSTTSAASRSSTTSDVLILSGAGSLATVRPSTVTNQSIVVPAATFMNVSQIIVSSVSNIGDGAATTRPTNGTGTVTSFIGSSRSTTSHTTNSILVVGGATAASTATRTGTATSVAPLATNTQPCNNYVELCGRKYSNITNVCAHNAFFHVANNAASNQDYGVVVQLNDGIRMIQSESHYVNDTIYMCHTSCDLLNAGTLESNLIPIREWVQAHPFDVVTILLVNSDGVNIGNYTQAFMNAGLVPYMYEPPKIPMRLEDWPTLAEMILTQKRVVAFIDYGADQSRYPYILEEWTQMWETPFSPTDPAFPCTQQRPTGLPRSDAVDFLYLANHNLNVQISFGSVDIVIPDYASLEEVNAVTGNASLGEMAETCIADWTRPPNFLLVDYYNEGNGSVFEVAAEMNDVTYNRKCCGMNTALTSDAPVVQPLSAGLAVAAVAAIAGLMILV